MNNASLPENPKPISELVADEIPEAIRDPHPQAEPTVSQSSRPGLFWKLLGLAIIAFGLAVWINYQFGILVVQTPNPSAEDNPTEVSVEPSSPPTESPTADQPPVAADLLGHLAYEEAPADELRKITADGSIKLRASAAKAYLDMADAARRQGIRLVPISGFRSVSDQDYLFFDIKAQRGQNATKRAEVSAPPGYSEHHTGYAIDIGDANFPDTHLQVSFEKTKAFEWLSENAAFYSFELSFPEGNPQGVSYEPWHWRFVGDRHSLETFYRAKSKFTSSPEIPEAEIIEEP